MITLDNKLVLSGRIIKSYPLRSSPNGLKIARFVLEHVSKQIEAGLKCEVKCKMFCIWVDPQNLEQIKDGNLVNVEGFVSNNAKSELVLHITKFLDKGN